MESGKQKPNETEALNYKFKIMKNETSSRWMKAVDGFNIPSIEEKVLVKNISKLWLNRLEAHNIWFDSENYRFLLN